MTSSDAFAKQRLLSLDTYRGMVLVLLLLESVEYGWQHALAAAHPSFLTRFIEFHASHTAWAGCSLWDLIQPSFMFMVGVSMPFSFSKRLKSGSSFATMLRQAAVRSLVLMALGIFLRTTYTDRTNWTFEDVITQIGLGYVFLFLLWNRGLKIQLAALGGILLAHWLLFALWPVREAIPDPEWKEPQKHLLTGFFAHWNINANPGHYFDQWFLNLFPRESRFEAHPEGYNTLNFIPSLAVMIMGLMAGEWLRSERNPAEKIKRLLVCGGGSILLGGVLHLAGVCPLVKKSWTSGFTLFSGGFCLVFLAALYGVIDVQQRRRWTFPFVVCGMNSIALYCLIWLLAGTYPVPETNEHVTVHWVDAHLQKHFGPHYAGFLGSGLEPLVKNLCNGLLLWLVCLWMYRRQLFLRV